MEKDSPFGFDQGGNPTFSLPRATYYVPRDVEVAAPVDGFISVPHLASANPFVQAERAGDEDARRVLAAAAKLNEPRVREVLTLLDEAKQALDEDSPLLVAKHVADARFAIAALLPPANIRISARLAEAISQSGRKAA